jgi:hypothetical protein
VSARLVQLWRSNPALVAVLVAVGVAFGPLLIGIEPVGGDPERLYRPVKTELARALREGRLPWWSDRFGVGVPLVAESHAAAFYPPNWPLYRFLPVHLAYRLAMWGHHVLMAAGVWVYGRRLGITPWGAALSGVSFTLCGFSAIHASHEVFYHALAWLPWALYFADRYAVGGQVADLAALALILGLQWTVGHFQIQTWTAALVVLAGMWAAHGSGRWVWRSMGLLRGVVWGTLIAAVQLVPSWELARFVNQADRPVLLRLFYWFPPAHLGELAAPSLFRSFGPMDQYWFSHGTSGYEASLYVGSLPLLLAIVGFLTKGRSLLLWKLIVPLSLALATMPVWWRYGYEAFLRIPIIGAFRAPARYTAIASLGLALLAGAGLDRLVSAWRYRLGLTIAVALATAALVWSGIWMTQAGEPLASEAGQAQALSRIGLSAFVLGLSLILVILWRIGWIPAGVLGGATLIELAALYYTGPIEWGWPLGLPGSSPVLTRLATDSEVVRVGGIENYPVLAGKATAAPYLGFLLPEPDRLLQSADQGMTSDGPIRTRGWLSRLGVSHRVVSGPNPQEDGAEILWRGEDPVLSHLRDQQPRETWSIVKIPGQTANARLAFRTRSLDSRGLWEFELWRERLVDDEVALLPGETIPFPGPPARSAQLLRWDGRSGEVEHDGSCVLVLTRTYFPGWTYRLDGGDSQAVYSVEGGLQGIPIAGQGRTRVVVEYRPTGIVVAGVVSLTALLGALVALAVSGVRGGWARRPAPL